MQTNNCLAKFTLDPDSNFFKQLQELLLPEIKVSSQSPSYLPAPGTFPSSKCLDLQHVIDSALRSHTTLDLEPARSPSPVPVPENNADIIESSNLFRQLYTPSGKWEWMVGHDIEDESCTFLSASTMCSTYYKRGRVFNRSLPYICKSWETVHCDHSFYSELALYKKQLRSLQGRCVPHVIGIFTGPGAINVAMEPPHSSFWIEASIDMPLSLKERCVDAIAQIHSCGVFHGDIDLQHILIGGDARVTVIDYQKSSAIEPNEKLFLLPATEADLRREMRKVKMKLDFPGARACEKDRRERCLKRNKHNAAEIRKSNLTPSYIPQLEEVPEDDALNPPILDMQEWQDWVAAPSLPRLFIVPGQSLQQRKGAYEAFVKSLESLQTSAGFYSGDFDNKPNNGSPSSLHEQVAQTGLREVNLPLTELVESSYRPPSAQSRPLGASYSMILGAERKQGTRNAIDAPPRVLDPFHSKPNQAPHPSPSAISARLALLRNLAESPVQAPGDLLPSLARQLLNTEMTRVQRSWLARKRTASSDIQDSERPIKRTRLDDEVSKSGVSFTVATTGQSLTSAVVPSPAGWDTVNPETSPSSSESSSFLVSESDRLGLGTYDWLTNLRYPCLPPSQRKHETWTRVAMQNLGNCALQELPHPDLIQLYPHHPRWAEPDVQVFLGRLHKVEKGLARAALQNPDRRITGPRHPRSLGNLKRTLSEIQHDLEQSSADTLIRGQAPSRHEMNDAHDAAECAVLGPSDTDIAKVKRPNDLSSPYDAPLDYDGLPRKVRFASPTSIAESENTKIPHGCSQPWYQRPFSLLTQVFNWV
ncbi:MAG: hypothetical protein NXY57DRAFT_791868 [Lentinula lateritia]|nr:MAG: hypothetical protein NXY57DRAFT_791868 [Lentinula lateritia]